MALMVGVDRGFITRQQGVERLTRIVDFLEHAPRYHGAWSHFMDGDTGQTMAVFGMFENGGDLVETSFLMQGLLAARQYFHGSSESEQSLYRRITQLWETIEWNWYRETPTSDFLYWHWSPQWSWQIHHPLIGFNEVMIAYLLGIASPDEPASSSSDGRANPASVLTGRIRAHACRAAIALLLGMGRTIAAGNRLSRRLVREHGWRPLRERTHLFWDQARCRRRHRGPALFHPLLVHGLRSA